MTFSDPGIKKLLDEFFVCTWKDIEGDSKAASSPRIKACDGAIPLARGSGFANLQILVFTPDARLLHALIGWIDAGDLKWELTQALITYEAVKAKPGSAHHVVSWRQDRIQEQLLGMKKRFAGEGFRIKPAPKEIPLPTPPTPGLRRHTARERKIMKAHPLAPEHRIKTVWLTGGRAGGGFPGNDIIAVPTSVSEKVTRRKPRAPERPVPWDDMPEALRTRYAEALGITPPEPKRPRGRKS